MEKGHLGKWLRIQIWQQKKVEYHCLNSNYEEVLCLQHLKNETCFEQFVCIYHDKLLFILAIEIHSHYSYSL